MNGFIAEMGFRIIHLYPAGTNGGRVASLRLEVIMVESIGESLWLAVGQRIMILVVAMLRTARLTAVDATIVVTVAIASLTTWTAFAVATLAARTALTLLIAFWFRNEHAVREFILARLEIGRAHV